MSSTKNDRSGTMMLTNRKINQEDYNTFLEGIHAAYGSAYGKITPNISRALRHFGQHLKDGDLDHITLVEKESRRQHGAGKKVRRTPIFEPQDPNDPAPESAIDEEK